MPETLFLHELIFYKLIGLPFPCGGQRKVEMRQNSMPCLLLKNRKRITYAGKCLQWQVNGKQSVAAIIKRSGKVTAYHFAVTNNWLPCRHRVDNDHSRHVFVDSITVMNYSLNGNSLIVIQLPEIAAN
ncbi:hypothetical protein KCP70_02280 [Salmonella enterica subsp. enterica]|nr:hypothetical protein KCP70_02280 [Salmonella enterica subsp. enterica]